MAEHIKSVEDLGPPVERGKPAQPPQETPTAGKERIQAVEDLGPRVDTGKSQGEA